MSSSKKRGAGLPENAFTAGLFRYLPYWPLFSVIIVSAVAGCFVFSLFKTPLYQASASIIIQDAKKGTENSKVVDELDVLQAKKIIDNETDVIISGPLVMEVMNKMNWYAQVFEEHPFRNVLLYNQSPVIVECKDPDKLIPQKNIPFTYNKKGAAVVLDNSSFGLNQWHNTPYGTLKFTANDEYISTGLKENLYLSLQRPKTMLKEIRERLTAKSTTKLSSIIEVSFNDEDPERAEDFVANLLDAYKNAGLKDKDILANNTLSFIDQRVRVVEDELRLIEQRKQQYTSRNGSFDISTQGRLFLESISENDRKMSEMSTNLAVLNELESYLTSGSNGRVVVPSTLGISDQHLSALVDKLYNTELQYESLKKTAGENNPIVLPLKTQIEKIKPDIRELISNQRKNLETGRKSMYSTNNSYAALFNNLPKAERELVDIERQQNIKSGVYSFLLQKKEEAALSQQTVLPESKIVNAEVSEHPVSPNMLLIYPAGIVLAILLGMGIVSAREIFGNKVMFRDQIEHATGFPVVGEISVGASHDPIVISDDTKTFIAEQFRRLRLTLPYLDNNEQPKKILITSAISGEGKSFIASNLALALALSGKKVALLDFDLNNPSLNNKLNLARDKGITDFLMDECSLEEIINRTDLDPKLYLLSTGRLPHNPTELLMNGRTALLFKQLDEAFDCIVVDTAPVIPVTDAYILSKFCDATLYVVRHKYTPKIFLERMDEDNRMHKLNNVGIIFNSVRSRGLGNNNYGYGYGYGYTYENGRKGKRLGHSLS